MSPEQNARIAQWAGMWKPGQKCDDSWARGNRCGHCGFQAPTIDQIEPFDPRNPAKKAEWLTHDIPCPDLSTPKMEAKVKAALAAARYCFGTSYASGVWFGWVKEAGAWSENDPPEEYEADTEAEALLLAIDKLLEGDDDRS